MSRTRIRQPCVLEVVDVMTGKLKAGQLEEPRPADTLDPLADPLVLAGMLAA